MKKLEGASSKESYRTGDPGVAASATTAAATSDDDGGGGGGGGGGGIVLLVLLSLAERTGGKEKRLSRYRGIEE